MIEVKIPAEIQDYKGKIIFGLTLRQFIGAAGAVITGAAIGLIGRSLSISDDILMWLIMLSVIPIIGYGFVRIQDMPFEEFVKHWFQFNFCPQKRAYETADIYPLTDISEHIAAEIIRNERIEKGEYEDEEDEN